MTKPAALPSLQLALVKATAPAVQENSLQITTRFYQRLFDNHPETEAFFDGTTPGQARRLANALVAYTENIDDLTPIEPVVQRIAVKHVEAGVKPMHYDIVGQELLGAVVDVLGDLPDDVLDAWAAAYGVLANLFIEAETALVAQPA